VVCTIYRYLQFRLWPSGVKVPGLEGGMDRGSFACALVQVNRIIAFCSFERASCLIAGFNFKLYLLVHALVYGGKLGNKSNLDLISSKTTR
jgi:hypothetical protein